MVPRLLVLLLLVACGPKKGAPEASTTPASTSDEPGFIDISMDIDVEDEEDFVFIRQELDECGSLVEFEPRAMMGQLNDQEIRCLDKKLRDAEKQTLKDKVSRVLMADAWAKNDRHRWETIARMHLEQIDRSDPDLCYKFALHLAKKGSEFADETMKWAEVALENRGYWTGDTHVARVNALYGLRAQAATEKWASMEKAYQVNPSDELLNAKDEARNEAKVMSREWLEYAKQAGKDLTVARQLCISAAGTQAYCDQL
jgi:hypothetical protein